MNYWSNFKSRAFNGPVFPALGGLSFLFLVEDFSFFFFACLLVDFFPGPKGLFLPKGGAKGGGRRCKHWPPGAGDPRYATGSWLSNCDTVT